MGVYYSEELKYARDLGYKIFPIRGYLFEKKHSPFSSFVSSLFASRQEAKKSGDEAMSYVYKILMNSLYGRFGINPKSTITEVCDRNRYDLLTQRDNLIFGDKLSEDYYIVSYVSSGNVDDLDLDWNPPRISAVQLAAAITACARIHMYKYTSRDDCYYTDTDSAVLGSPLPEDEVSSTELGKLKLEHIVKNGIFLAPKSYMLVTDTGNIMKHKGLAKGIVNYERFMELYADQSLTKQVTVESNFRINWQTLSIAKKELQVSLGIQVDNKRDPVYDENNVWVDTQPKEVIDFGGEESTILKCEYKILREKYALLEENAKESAKRIASLEEENEFCNKTIESLMTQNKENAIRIASLESENKEYAKRIASMESEIAKMREEIKLLSAAKLPSSPVMPPVKESTTVLEVPQPTLNKKPWDGMKPKGKKPKGKKGKKGKKPKPNDTS